MLCKRHVQNLIQEKPSRKTSKWLDHVYRLFFYDAEPFDQIAHHPILNKQIHFSKSKEAEFRRNLFDAIRRKRKFALRLGKVNREDGWRIKDARRTKGLLKTRDFVPFFQEIIRAHEGAIPPPKLSEKDLAGFCKVVSDWQNLEADDVRLSLRQKGVDMRIGIDISTIALKKQADTIILITGDSDFVPAAKVARREGVEFLLDPLWHSINSDLHEHVDGVVSGFRRSKTGKAELSDFSESETTETEK
ncbi:MAG: NYN domain-containing protein [Opitutales bacterium]|nr:NYN domain-containing protein [Opitutales bacterium]